MTILRTALTLLLLTGVQAHAAWQLDGERSSLSFVSTKAINIAEVHRFGDMSGSVSDDGMVEVTIGLDSVDTAIELRDDRMKEMLFETGTYATAGVTAQVDMAALAGLEPGEAVSMTVEGNVSLHGEARPIAMQLLVTRSGEDTLLVASERPVLVNAPDFKLAEGIEKLREVAGLPNISLAVPVSFVLTFVDR